MDILLDNSGDMIVTKLGDILLEDSVAQKININRLSADYCRKPVENCNWILKQSM